MAAALAPNPIPLRRRAVGNRTMLFANEAAKLVNVPAVGSFTRVFHELAKSLKPHILQAPKANDQDAQEQVALIERYRSLLGTIADGMSQLDETDFRAESLALFRELDEYLANASCELQMLQNESLVAKFTSQTEIQHSLDTKREEILGRILMFSFQNGLRAHYAVARSRVDLKQFVESVNWRLEDKTLGNEELKWLVAVLCSRLGKMTGKAMFHTLPMAGFFFLIRAAEAVHHNGRAASRLRSR